MENKIKGENFLNWSVNVETLLNKSLKTQHNYLTLYKQQIPGYLLGQTQKITRSCQTLDLLFSNQKTVQEKVKSSKKPYSRCFDIRYVIPEEQILGNHFICYFNYII